MPKLSSNKTDIQNFDKHVTNVAAKHTIIPDSVQKKIKDKNYKFGGFDN